MTNPKKIKSYRLAHHAGEQGARPLVWDQAKAAKYATGTKNKRIRKRATCPYFLKGSVNGGTNLGYSLRKGNTIKNPVKQTGMNWKSMICPYFLKGSCKFGIRCRNPHSRGGCIKIIPNETKSMNTPNGSNRSQFESNTGFITVTRRKKCTAKSRSAKVRPTATKDSFNSSRRIETDKCLNDSNMFEPLLNLEASNHVNEDLSSNQPTSLVRQNIDVSDLRPSDKRFKKSAKCSVPSKKNPNPTGDIWDQSSLNLNTLFEVKTQSKLRLGIWNAESVRHKEN